MKERPILFSGAMVRALLDGTKTQTRRVVKIGGELPPEWATFGKESHIFTADGSRPNGHFYSSEEQTPGEPLKKLRRWPVSKKGPLAGDHYHARCPYGAPGDRLWVKETHALRSNGAVVYRADCKDFDPRAADAVGGRWRPSIHMPRWASRLTLTITDVRVERLQEISARDALAEGISLDGARPGHDIDIDGGVSESFAVGRYRELWDSLNAARGYGWDVHPWVWVVSFAPRAGGGA